MIVVDRPNILIEWDEAKQYMRFEFRGFVEGEEYRGSLDKALKLLAEKKATKILWDLRKMKVLTPADQTWAESDWTPRLVKETKVRRSVLVVPTSTVAQMSLKRVQTRAAPVMKDEMVDTSFDNMADAEKWLLSGN